MRDWSGGFIAGFLMVFLGGSASADWSFEFCAGNAYNFGTTLTIEQTGFSDLTLDASYDTQGFKVPIYYILRGGHWGEKAGWEGELIHHKVVLQNTTVGVERFEVSHGYNLLFVNRVWDLNGWILRAGGGFVIAHAESTIRGEFLAPGYEWTGPAGQFSVGRRFYFTEHFFGLLEGKWIIARAGVSVADGKASVPNVSLHGVFGIGFTL